MALAGFCSVTQTLSWEGGFGSYRPRNGTTSWPLPGGCVSLQVFLPPVLSTQALGRVGFEGAGQQLTLLQPWCACPVSLDWGIQRGHLLKVLVPACGRGCCLFTAPHLCRPVTLERHPAAPCQPALWGVMHLSPRP